jgi:hypothetical protein
MRRLLKLLQREPAVPYSRPNELRLEAVRAERLRREAQGQQRAARFPPVSEEQMQRREPPPATVKAAPRPALVMRPLSRAELRRAIVLGEIIGPPLALRDPGSAPGS